MQLKKLADEELMEALHPELIRISNDSSKHAHHSAMRALNGGSGETRELSSHFDSGPRASE